MREVPKLAPGFLLALAATLLLASCAPKAAPVDTTAAAKALTQLDDEWSKAAGAKDLARVASFYAQDAIAYPPGAPAAVGFDAAKKVWGAYFADSTFAISWKTDHAKVAEAGDLGFTSGTYEDSYKGPAGVTVRETGKYLCVWAKQADGSWKAVHDMWNADR
jgi:ketosteroid isomerase-like protein